MTSTKLRSGLPEGKHFCSRIFNGLSVTPSGACAPCCLFEKMIPKNESDYFKIWEDSVSEIYNSAYMKELRSLMLQDRPIEACRQCYQVEAYGGTSLRNHANEFNLIKDLTQGSQGDYSPQYIDLKIKNTCNLKCRMCQPRDSHLIQNEFRKISESEPAFLRYSNTNSTDPDLGLPYSEIPNWYETPSFQESFDKILPHILEISIVGGEPLLLDEFYDVLNKCVAQNVAHKIEISITTNLMHLPLEKLSELLPKFKKILFNISLDAVGRELEYIRFPSKFEKIVKNFNDLYQLKTSGNIFFQISPTVQIYNVLYLDSVYRFVFKLLKLGFQFTKKPVHLTYVEFPIHLNVRVLPKNARGEAITRLQKIQNDFPEFMGNYAIKDNLDQLIHILENDFYDYDYLPEFLYYSKLLDSERSQKGSDYLPDLFKFFVDIAPKVPLESFHKLRENGWKLARAGKLQEAIEMFENAVMTSGNKELDYREMAWMKMSLELHDDSRKYYEMAYALDPNDRYVLKGLALQYKIAQDKVGFERIIKNALIANPDDKELIEAKKIMETVSI